jgi:hypothetical protein
MKSLVITAALVLCSVSLFGSADLVTTVFAPSPLLRAGYSSSVFFQVLNNGPDTAAAVKLSISSDVPNTCSCDLGDIPPGQLRTGNVSYVVPSINGTISFSATASSNTQDPNSSNNSASVVVNVSTDPDLAIHLSTPFIQDLSLPFTAVISLDNASKTTSHDVEVTIDFDSDVAVRSLPAGCTSVMAGRVVCRVDSVSTTATDTPGPKFTLQLLAPSAYSNGFVTFKAVVTEREHDFDPISNSVTQQMALYKTFYVINTNNDGGGSLRFAILDANGQCRETESCAIAFRIDQAATTPLRSILITSPLPPVTAPHIRIDGATQSAFSGNKNPDGPDVEITGGGTLDSDGLVVTNCGAEVANLAINGFVRNGVSVGQTQASQCAFGGGTNLHHLFVGTDPTGSIARPNARGIGTSFFNGFSSSSVTSIGVTISDSVISGNLHSGIFGLSGRLTVQRNRIGVKAHSDDPLPNGNAGVLIGVGGFGSDVGASSSFSSAASPGQDGNVIAFNGEMGVAVAAGVADVAIRRNRIWGNKLLGIDIGLDGPTQSTGGVTMPAITLAHYDPVTQQTVIEGTISPTSPASTFNAEVGLFANDAPDPTGLGEGQRSIGVADVPTNQPNRFRFTVDGDLTGQFISATMTRIQYNGFAKPQPDGIANLFFSQTSEFSPAIEVR